MSIFDTIAQPVKKAASTLFDVISKPVKGVEKFLDAPDNSAAGVLKNTVIGLAPAAKDVAVDVAQSVPRALASVGLTAMGKKELKPDGSKTFEFLYGKEPVKSLPARSEDATKTLESYGFSPGFSKGLGGLGVVGGTILDLYPGAKGETTLIKNLVKETSESAIRTLIKDSVKNVTDEAVEKVVPLIAKATDEKAVKQLLEGAAKQSQTPAQRLFSAIREAEPVREDISAAQKAERSRRASAVEQTFQGGSGEQTYFDALSKLKGQLLPEKPKLGEVRAQLEQPDVDALFGQVQKSPLDTFDKISASNGLAKILQGEVPQPAQLSLLEDVFGSDLVKAVMSKRSTGEKVKDIISEVVNLPRALITSVDFSAPLRQGLVLTTSKPKQSIPAFKEMFKQAFSEDAFNGWLDALKESPDWKKLRDAGLYVSDPRKLAGGLSAKEENFMTNLAEKIPVWGKLVQGSQRAYLGFLNKLRVDVFRDLSAKFEAQGVADEDTLKGLAEFINNATGRGSLPGTLGRNSQLLNSVFFSPRLIASRLNMLNPVWYAKQPAPVRKEAIKSFATFVGLGTTIATLAKLGGADVELDPRSTDFGKIKVGNTRWDIWGGFQQWVRVFSQLATAERKTTKGKIQPLSSKEYPFTPPTKVAIDFARGKLAPVPALALELIDRQKLFGGDLSLKEEAISNIVPLYLQDMKEAIGEQGISALFSVGLPAVFGVGSQTYDDTGGAAVKKVEGKGSGILPKVEGKKVTLPKLQGGGKLPKLPKLEKLPPIK